MALCQRCHQDISFWIGGVNRQTGLCKDCTHAVRMELMHSLAQGQLPSIGASIHLDAGELCHMEVPVTYQKRLKSSMQLISGRMIATNKRLHFIGPTGSFTVTWSNVLSIGADRRGFHLQLSRQSGSGYYQTKDPEYVSTLLNAATQVAKHQVVPTQTGRGNRTAIPQEIKTAVWQRDGGRCIQCGATQYLEFDHIIPLARGGAHSVNNIQLLCRECNGKKSSRI